MKLSSFFIDVSIIQYYNCCSIIIIIIISILLFIISFLLAISILVTLKMRPLQGMRVAMCKPPDTGTV